MNLVFSKSFLEIFCIYNGLFDKIFSPQSHWTLTKSQITLGKVIQIFFFPSLELNISKHSELIFENIIISQLWIFEKGIAILYIIFNNRRYLASNIRHIERVSNTTVKSCRLGNVCSVSVCLCLKQPSKKRIPQHSGFHFYSKGKIFISPLKNKIFKVRERS